MTDRVKTIVIIGNGHSLKDVDLRGICGVDTFGMNLAYRYWEKTDWWPTYYGCFDKLYLSGYEKDIVDMIRNDKVGIKKYFILKRFNKSKKICKLALHGDLYNFSMELESFGNGGNAAVNCCQVSVCLGYKKIILLGVDCNYVDLPEEEISLERDTKLIMKSTPVENPNYFFKDYHRAGESHNKANLDKYHFPSWEVFSEFSKTNGVEVVNCTSGSKLNIFRKAILDEELVR